MRGAALLLAVCCVVPSLSAGQAGALDAVGRPDASPAVDGVGRSDVLARVVIVGDAIPAPLTATPGDPARGRAIVLDRHLGLCLLCHSGPFPEERFQGTLAPDLAGVGSRWSPAQLRLRIVDARRINPDTLMPPYVSIEGLSRVARTYAGRPILEAQQVEDVIAFLATLRESP